MTLFCFVPALGLVILQHADIYSQHKSMRIGCLMPSLKVCGVVSAARHELALGNTYVAKEGVAPPKSEVDPVVWPTQLVFETSDTSMNTGLCCCEHSCLGLGFES